MIKKIFAFKLLLLIFGVLGCNRIVYVGKDRMIKSTTTTIHQCDVKSEINKIKECRILIDSCIIEYDSRGLIQELLHYDSNNMIVKGFKSEYDSTGLMKKNWTYGKQKKIEKISEIKYDKERHLIETRSRESRMTNVYNSEGKLVEKYIYEPAAPNHSLQIIKKREYRYAEREKEEYCFIRPRNYEYGRSVLLYYDTFELECKALYRYDESDNLIEELFYSPEGELWDKDEYEYDEKGNEIINRGYVGDELSYETTKRYDKNSCLIESKTKLINNDEISKVAIWRYEYDRWNNWVLWLQIRNDTLVRRIERKIVYH